MHFLLDKILYGHSLFPEDESRLVSLQFQRENGSLVLSNPVLIFFSKPTFVFLNRLQKPKMLLINVEQNI